MIYQWVERIRELLENLKTENVEESHEEEEQEEEDKLETSIVPEPVEEKCPEIYHGEVVVDRKSSFQGHAARVTSTAQVK